MGNSFLHKKTLQLITATSCAWQLRIRGNSYDQSQEHLSLHASTHFMVYTCFYNFNYYRYKFHSLSTLDGENKITGQSSFKDDRENNRIIESCLDES